MNLTPSSSQETSNASKTMERSGPSTPLKTLATLAVPDLLSFARRSSPRAEEASKKGTNRKLETTRQRLLTHKSVDDAVQLLRKSNRVVVLSGAGISTSVGIPDFRSDKGLYQKLSQDLGIQEPEDFFSNSYFQGNPAQFFQYIKAVLPRAVACPDGTYKASDPSQAIGPGGSTIVPRYSPTHAFLAMLQAKGKLLTNYTQNIDGIELAAGLHNSSFIQCHGAWDTATCLTCGKKVSAKKYLPIVFQGNIPYCKCSTQVDGTDKKTNKKPSTTKSGRKRKRQGSEEWGSDHSSDAFDNVIPPRGLLKPDITFFEDPITEAYKDRLDSDKSVVDLLIVIGTSLKVAPIQQMLYQIPPHVPQIYISRTRFSGSLCSLPGVQVDVELLGEADAIIEELCRRAGWSEQLKAHLWEESQMKIKRFSSDNEDNKVHNDYGTLSKKPRREPTTNSTRIADNLGPEWHEKRLELSNRIAGTPLPRRGKIHPENRPLDQDKPNLSITETPIPKRNREPVPSPPTNVKVELVEGTTHQWRITRLS